MSSIMLPTTTAAPPTYFTLRSSNTSLMIQTLLLHCAAQAQVELPYVPPHVQISPQIRWSWSLKAFLGHYYCSAPIFCVFWGVVTKTFFLVLQVYFHKNYSSLHIDAKYVGMKANKFKNSKL